MSAEDIDYSQVMLSEPGKPQGGPIEPHYLHGGREVAGSLNY